MLRVLFGPCIYWGYNIALGKNTCWPNYSSNTPWKINMLKPKNVGFFKGEPAVNFPGCRWKNSWKPLLDFCWFPSQWPLASTGQSVFGGFQNVCDSKNLSKRYKKNNWEIYTSWRAKSVWNVGNLGPKRKFISIPTIHFHMYARGWFVSGSVSNICLFFNSTPWIDISCKFWDFLWPSNKLCIKILETYVQCSSNIMRTKFLKPKNRHAQRSYLPWK